MTKKRKEINNDDNNDENPHPFGHLCFLCFLSAIFDFSSLPLTNSVLSNESVVFRVRYFSILE